MTTRTGPHLGACHVCGRDVRGHAAGMLWEMPGELDLIVLCRGACEEAAGRAIARALRGKKQTTGQVVQPELFVLPGARREPGAGGA